MNFINNMIKHSIHNRLTVLAGAAAIALAGLFAAERMDIDVFPDLTAPTVVVMTDAGGMAAEEVERLVTFPIETAVNGATDVRRVRSSSSSGVSFVWVEFDWGTDIYKARQTVSEKMMVLAGTLPQGITPVLAPQSSVMGEILFVGMQADSTSMMQLRTLADWVVKPAILATGGVSQVTIIGGDYKQYQVLADPLKMNAYGVSMERLAEACRQAADNSAGGVVRDYGNEYAIRGMARTADTTALAATLVGPGPGGRPVTIGDVARVTIGSAQKMGYASHCARPCVILSISKQPNVNTLRVTENIERNLEDIRKSLPPDVTIDSRIFRQADFIEASVGNVGRALVEGALFVIVTLFLFLGSFRTTVISVVAIPLSLLGTLVALHLMGMNINTMTLGGMCIAIGSLVDDAIIDVENVYKRLRQNRALPPESRRPALDVIFEASKEIRASILNATFIIMVAFVPLFFLSGMEGRMLKPLGITYIVSLFMSLVVAMTVTPLMCRLVLSGDRYLDRNVSENRLSRGLAQGYRRMLARALGHRRAVLGVTAALLVVAVVLFARMGRSFLPEFNEGSLTISAVTRPGVSLDVSNELGNAMERELLKIPEVSSTSRRTGRGELDEHSQATNSAEIDVNFSLGGRSKDEFMADVRATLASIPGIAATVGQPLGHRIDHMLSGTRANIAIKLFGTDLSRMQAIGTDIRAAVGHIDGLVDVNVEQQTETPQLQIRADRGRLARYGIGIEQFNAFVANAFVGQKMADIYEGQRSFDLVLRLDDRYVGSIDRIRTALIDTGDGQKVPLEEVADIVSAGGPGSISRENVQRKLVISANVQGRDLAGVVDDIRSAIGSQIALPEGYRIEYGGQFESAQSASRTLMLASLAAIGIIFMLLLGEFRDASLAAIILLNLPLALIGGVLAVWLTSGVVSIPSIIGFITLFGIATRNGILLVSKYEHLGRQGLPVLDTIIEGSADRLNPILMTALTAALALIPLVSGADKSGNEIQSPMAVVVLGGLLTSTLLNIFVVPMVYQIFQQKRHRQ